jgi:imidazole glycerol-phosphate synthase subunit HisF
MLLPRIIPVLLIHGRGLVKTIKFSQPKYVGDPLNAVRIFNEKEADELMVFDIDASRLGQEPDYRMIESLAAECRMPLCYGGGIRSADQAKRILALGVEKVSLSNVLFESPGLVDELAAQVGAQSIVATLDVKKKFFGDQYECHVLNGSKSTGVNLVDFAQELEKRGAGEIAVNSIDRDGTMVGYDLTLAKCLKEKLTVPITVMGGAGSLEHISELTKQHSLVGAAAGSLFVFKGKFRAVLISYPNFEEKKQLF